MSRLLFCMHEKNRENRPPSPQDNPDLKADGRDRDRVRTRSWFRSRERNNGILFLRTFVLILILFDILLTREGSWIINIFRISQGKEGKRGSKSRWGASLRVLRPTIFSDKLPSVCSFWRESFSGMEIEISFS